MRKVKVEEGRKGGSEGKERGIKRKEEEEKKINGKKRKNEEGGEEKERIEKMRVRRWKKFKR